MSEEYLIKAIKTLNKLLNEVYVARVMTNHCGLVRQEDAYSVDERDELETLTIGQALSRIRSYMAGELREEPKEK